MRSIVYDTIYNSLARYTAIDSGWLKHKDTGRYWKDIEEKFGIKVVSGKRTYIVDEEKFILFLLKYSS